MTEDLLGYYDRELSYLRKLGAQFARAHPKIAGRLRLGADSVEDPHVSRLIESVAFLNARVRKKLDDDFPELTDAILGVLAPHYLAPVPSMSIVRFECDPELTCSYELSAGTLIESDPGYGTPCQFRTSYPVTTWPIRLTDAALVGAPYEAPPVPRARSAAAILRLRFQTAADQCPIGELGIDGLRLYLRGQPSRIHELYELLFDDVACVAVSSGPGDRNPLVLPAESIRTVGFERQERILPFSGRTPPGLGLLTEFFVFPPKFHFFDLTDLGGKKMASLDDRLDVYVFLRRYDRELEQSVDASSFAMGCTPVVNLFEKRAEPIELDGSSTEYHVVPDARNPAANEVCSIDSVVALSRDGGRQEFHPFYGIRHPGDEEGRSAYWSATRRNADEIASQGDSGTEMFLSLVGLDGDSVTSTDWVLDARVTCLNRDLPEQLPFGGGEPRLHCSEGGGGIRTIECLQPFSPTLRPPRGRGALWRAVSQLSLNHHSITGGEHGADALREILRVCDLADTAASRSVIASIKKVESRSCMIRARLAGHVGFARGTEVFVELDEHRLVSAGTYLFSAILGRFLASYCTVNSFTQLVTTAGSREEGLRRWPPRTGSTALA